MADTHGSNRPLPPALERYALLDEWTRGELEAARRQRALQELAERNRRLSS